MSEDLKFKISADGQQAITETERVSDAQRKMAGTTDQVGDAAEKAAPKQRGLAGSIAAIASNWALVSVVSASILKFLTDVATEASKAAGAVVEVGKALRGLSVNVGGKRAGEIYEQATKAAAEYRLSPEDRAQLLQGAARYTDIRDNATPEQVRDFINRSAQIQRLTGVGGTQQTDAMIAFENAGMIPSEAESAAVQLFSSGFNAQTITDVLNKTGARGGRQMLGLLLGARGAGMDTDRISRTVPSLMDVLDRTDSSGRLDPQLARLGLKPDMSIAERINHLASGAASGQLQTRDIHNALGTSQNIATFDAFSTAIASGQVERANTTLRDYGPIVAEAELALQDNPYVRAADRENVRRLYEQVRREKSLMGGYGERLREFESNAQGIPGGSVVTNTFGLGTSLIPDDMERRTRQSQRLMGVPAPTTVININQQINNGDNPDTAPINRH